MFLTVSGVSKTYGAAQILREISFALGPRKHAGVVGANGVGKTTLLEIISGNLEPDSGHVTISPQSKIGYVPQHLSTESDSTVDDLVHNILNNVYRLEQRLRSLEQQMGEETPHLDQVMREYGEVTAAFERAGGYEIDHKIGQVFEGLQVNHISRRRRLSTLSGGEKARLVMALTLIETPDLLLLDEPTNHLDYEAIEWLEQYLIDYPGAMLFVSHDRLFLNRVADVIIEISEHSREARLYTGNYDHYSQVKRIERQKWEEAYERQYEEIKALRHAIKVKSRQVGHGRAPSDPNKMAHDYKGARVEQSVSRNIRTAEEKLRRIEEDPIPRPPKPMQINPDFHPREMQNKHPIVVSRVSKSFGAPVLKDVSLAVRVDSRILITGENGTGKSTLLKIMAGACHPDAGEVTRARKVRIGYLEQEHDALPEDTTLFDYFRQGLLGSESDLKGELMRYRLFQYADLSKLIGQLSIGQRRKLQIARLIATRANVLLLDEPTNHISFDVLEEFESALLAFKGPIITISHDRRFIEQFSSEVWQLGDGQLVAQHRF